MKNSIVFLLLVRLANSLLISQNEVSFSEVVQKTVAGQTFVFFNGAKSMGYAVKSYENNNIESLKEFQEGKPTGFFKQYYESGKLKNKDVFKNRKPNGFLEGYYENG